MNKLPLYLALTLGFLGILEVVLKCVYIPDPYEWPLGLLESAQDPGKSLFHIVILPSAMYLLFRYLKEIDIRKAFSTPLKKRINSIIIFVFILIPPVYAYNDTLDQFFSEGAMPWDFADKNTSTEFMRIRIDALEKIKEKSESDLNTDTAIHKEYMDSLNDYFSGRKKDFTTYWKLSSPRKKYADFLSFVGVISACMLIGAVALSAGIKNRIESGFIDKLFLAYGMLATWIPMRMYSDWYGSLGDTSISNDGLIIAGVIVVILGILFFILQRPTKKVGVTTASITFLCTVIGAIGAFKSDWFLLVASLFQAATPLMLLCIYAVIFVSFASIIVFAVEEKANKGN